MNTDCHSSLHILANQLCDTYCRDGRKAFLVQPRLSKATLKRRLRKKFYETLFKHQKGPHRSPLTGSGPLNPDLTPCELTCVEQVYVYAYNLRCQRKFDQANRLEDLVKKLLENAGEEEQQHANAVLIFLLALSNSVQSSNPPVLGHGDQKLPIVYISKESEARVLPVGPSVYGDSRLPQQGTTTYMQYPRWVFEEALPVQPPLLPLDTGLTLNTEVFHATPGSQLPGNGLFRPKSILEDSYERNRQFTLFGGLVSGGRSSSLDIKLEVPELREDSMPEIRIPKIPKVQEVSQTSEDEGFMEGSTPSSEVASSPVSTQDGATIWELALKYTRNRHYTWENVGKEPGPTERPYITEAGSQAFDQLNDTRMQQLSLVDAKFKLPTKRLVTQRLLVKDVLNLLIGLPSHTFLFDEALQTFTMKEGTYLSGTSPEGIQTLCSSFLECGSLYSRLSTFSLPPVVNSLYTAGLIFQAFTEAVRKYLQHYRDVVLSVPEGMTLLELKVLFHKVIMQMRYLGALCRCDTGGNSEEEFPTGIQLLSYLYQEALNAVNSDNYPMLLSLLCTTAGPYLIFVQGWVFEGVCRDIYGELQIRVSGEYLQRRDRSYWTKGYQLLAAETTSSVPLFLTDLANDIFVCGKSINLLKLCCPEHFMCNIDVPIPRLMITFSEEELSSIEQRCQIYVNMVEMRARQILMTREQMLERVVQARQDLVQRARQAQVREMDRLKARIEEIRKAEDIKKRKQFRELKEQMEKDLRRRAMEVEQEKQEDRDRIDAQLRKEEEAAEAEAALEERAREELVEYYQKLTEEAAFREQKALWRVRRRQLDLARQTFLQQDEDRWSAEMRKKQGSVGDSMAIPVVPSTDQTQLDVSMPTLEGPTTTDGATNLMDLSLRHLTAPSNLPRVTIPALPDAVDSWDETQVSRGTAVDGRIPTGDLLNVSHIDPPQTQSHTSGQDRNLLDMSIGVLPKWAQKGVSEAEGGSDGKKQAKDEKKFDPEGKELPTWASEGLKRPLVPAFGLDTYSSTDLPGWARNPEGKLVEIDDIDLNFRSSVTPSALSGQETGSKVTSNLTQEAAAGTDDIITTDSKVKEGEQADSAQKPGKDVIDSAQREEVLSKSSDDTQKVKQVSVAHPSRETEDTTDGVKVHRKPVAGMHAGKESAESISVIQTRHKKMVEGSHVGQQSEPDIKKSISGLRLSEHMHAGKESEPQESVIKKQSAFGHVSETSSEEKRMFPRMKRRDGYSALMESLDTSFQVKPKPHLKFRKDLHASSESDSQKDVDQARREKFKEINVHGHVSQETMTKDDDEEKRQRKFLERNVHGHSSVESQYVDTDELRRKRFQEMNVKGHASDSSVQRLLYGEEYMRLGKVTEEGEEDVVTSEQVDREEPIWTDLLTTEPYKSSFPEFVETPRVDLMANIIEDPLSQGDYGKSITDDITAANFMSLPVLLKRAVTAPLMAQISLVNRSVVNYLMVDLKIDQHFEALRRFLFMEDGEFAQTLSDQLCEKLAMNPMPHEMLNPVFLNNVLNRALRYSIHRETEAAKNISFAVKFLPLVLQQNAADTLDCLELRYKVDWPLNIIITDTSLNKYSKVFSFLLQLKRIVWALKDIWHRLKRDASQNNAANAPLFRQLQLFRHEMQHFVRVMQGYISNQLIHVGWLELQESLKTRVHNLDDLHHVHGEYINNAVFRRIFPLEHNSLSRFQQHRIGNYAVSHDQGWVHVEAGCLGDVRLRSLDIRLETPRVDLMANIIEDPLSQGDYGKSITDDITAANYMSLPVLLKRAVTAPLMAQISLVNRSVVNYLMVDLKIDQHFEALRRFLFMEDGEFAQTLSDQLCEKLAMNPMPHEMLNPVFLNNVLNRALRYSIHRETEAAKNISFAVKFLPLVLQQNAADTLDCLELRYKVDWPLNIIITDTSLNKYSKVFSFLLQLKRIVWALKDIWHRLKRDASQNNAANAPLFRQLQLFRHEMQHFVRVMQGYISNQLIHVGWLELQESLKTRVHNLDDLHHVHGEYINNAVFSP
ncbi:gamma-tubulin complex component 6-like [Lingula anatina]|uniref:Gamma-tubulin complex component 6-like n=1 Tax=Lingula anatina TaxID=7574 RepID=A0A2R2MSS6_LINAN|nr:gamma-tubulin complex component 6-like [Lingula anatina]|eukprot:XP_023933311.1 gamma-tubulin complex component 6-like [Lingula anatina]